MATSPSDILSALQNGVQAINNLSRQIAITPAVTPLVIGTTPVSGGSGGVLGTDSGTLEEVFVRTKLTSDTTFYISTTGSDVSGDGSFGNPWLTGQNAVFQILHNYDGGDNNITLQLIGSPFNVSAGQSFAFFGEPPVGIQQFIIQGDPANPSSFVVDGTAGDSGVFVAPSGIGMYVRVDGITLQNFANGPAINVQTYCFVDIGAVNFNSNDTNFDIEGGGFCSGRVPGTWTFSGAHGQMTYIGQSNFDTNNSPIVFAVGTSFSFAVLNVDDGGFLAFQNNVTGTCTGPRVNITNGGVINAGFSGSQIPVASLPGNSDGFNNGGWYNGSNLTPAILVGNLPVLPGTLAGGERFMVTNSNSTTFGAIVAAGGANVVPVYNDGANNWRIG